MNDELSRLLRPDGLYREALGTPSPAKSHHLGTPTFSSIVSNNNPSYFQLGNCRRCPQKCSKKQALEARNTEFLIDTPE
jgi:hypothetical protein